MSPVTRPLTTEDVPALLDLLLASREFLAPFEPERGARWFTVEGQRQAVAEVLARQAQGLHLAHVVVAPDGSVAGRINLNNIVRGAFQSCSVGYWVGERYTRQGLATAALAELLGIAFDELGLHRVEAGTLVHNVASQRVLARNGFEQFGLAPQYLQIAGRWQDHMLFQRLNPAPG